MKHLITEQDRIKVAKSCKENPYKMFSVLDAICKELQLTTVREFAKQSVKSERTIYNMVKDIEASEVEVLIICGEKFIPKKLNKHLLF